MDSHADGLTMGSSSYARSSFASRGAAAETAVKFGFVTDLHWSSVKSPYGNRYTTSGDDKLRLAVAAFNAAAVEFTVFGGDLIDGGSDTQALADLETIHGVFAELQGDAHFVLGNHDMEALSKAEFLGEISDPAPDNYYSFDSGGMHFIILDACYDADDDSSGYDSGAFDYTDTYVNPAQLTWLESDLSGTNLPTIVFCHQRLDESGNADHRVDNRSAVRGVLAASEKVMAVFGGHAHMNTRSVINGIPYFVMQAATEDEWPASAYALVRAFKDGRVYVEGYGTQLSYAPAEPVVAGGAISSFTAGPENTTARQMGYLFTPDVDMDVTRLEVYAAGNVAGNRTLRLWKASGTAEVLAEVTVDTDDQAGWVGVDITPVQLTAGSQYVVTAQNDVAATIVAHARADTWSFSDDITFVEGRTSNATSTAFPSNTSTSKYLVNFYYQVSAE